MVPDWDRLGLVWAACAATQCDDKETSGLNTLQKLNGIRLWSRQKGSKRYSFFFKNRGEGE